MNFDGPWRAVMVGALLIIAVAAPASGQTEPEHLSVGRAVAVALTEGAEQLSGSPFRAYRFAVNEGSVYQVILSDVEFEPDLRVARAVGGLTDYLAMAGDQGMGAGAMIEMSSPLTGDLLVVVRSADGDVGAFRLMVREAIPGVVEPLELGRPTLGALGVESAPTHPFRASSGEELQITVRSREFDTYLEVGRLVDGRLIVIESDDDGAGSTDSRVYFTPSETGSYAARVTDYRGDTAGAYAILLTLPPELPEARPLPLGERVNGRLTESSPMLDSGHPFDDWQVVLEAGQRHGIDLQSAEFDTYLSVGRMEGRRFVELATNDDARGLGPSNTDSRVLFTAPDDGAYVVRVRAFGTDQRGAYTLSTSPLAAQRSEAAGGDLAVGETVAGTITDEDAVLDDAIPFQQWRLTVSTGGRMDIQARSSDFDTYLILGRISGGRFDEIASNDDWRGSENGTDSRIMATLDPGEYFVRIRPFRDTGRGDYQLSAHEMAPARAVPAGGTIQAGQTVTAVLSDEDTRLIDDDVPYQEWVFLAEPGERFVIQLSSGDFDSYLSLGYMFDGGYVELDANDDYGDGLDSRIEFAAPDSGEYVIRARPLFDGSGGEYTLSLTAMP